MGNRVPRLATPCFVAGGHLVDGSAPDAPDAADNSIAHILSFDGRDGPAFTGAIHGILLPSNQSTLACTAASTVNGQLSLSGSSSFDSSRSFSFRALQPRQYLGPLEYCTWPSTSSATPSAVSVTRQPRRTDEQILADLYAARHRRQSQVSKKSLLDTLRQAVASMLCVAPCGSLENKQPDEPVVAVVNGACEAARNKYSIENGKNSEVTVDGSAGVQWARGKAGEDRVHVVVSEERGWMFVGIYDGFNGPDAADYLLANLYTSVCCKLSSILSEDEPDGHEPNDASTSGGACRRTARRRMVLDALARALRETEEGYFAAAEARAAECPELAMTGSCVLVVLMKGADVYVMNVGDSRAVLAHRAEPDLSGIVMQPHGDDLAGVKEEIKRHYDDCEMGELTALQLTMDHSTSVYKEVRRIRSEHLDDPSCIVNGRVKGSLKVTRAFGVGYLKEPRWNRALLKVFQVDYVGTSPYIICRPYLRHHRLGTRDKFLILSSDGLYQYFTNEEVVAQVEAFTSRYPKDDPAKYLSLEILLRAANRAGMGFHELIKIAQGDRRQYHDDVSILIISLEGKVWRSVI